MSRTTSRLRTGVVAASIVATDMLGGAALGSTVIANAEGGTSSPAATASTSQNGTASPPAVDESTSQRPDERLLTGTDADKARAAALAAYPGATIQRVETDSDGVYEAHVVTADGQRLIVQMDKNFTVTGTQSHGARGASGSASSRALPQTPAA
jgi:uncharacterized membrane protein YkoI